jgi:UDP-GlcNAc:undecaprenyl-phosphate GlcNAc-1-phosphate transferase
VTTFSFGAVASFFVCLLAIITLRPLAVAIDLVDKPGGRKTHHGNVPIVGGIAMFLGLAVGLGLNPIDSLHAETLIAASGLLVVTGLLDDRFELSPWLRLPAQAAATLLVISAFYPNPTLSFGNPLGTGEIVFHGLAACLVILFFVVGAINAMNMLDGMDGLAGAVSLVALASIAALTWNSGLTFTSHVSLTLGGAVVAFLFFNLPTRRNRELRCFMGDAGSMMIGFLLALLCMRMSQGDTPVMAPVGVLWLVALPIYELLWTILRRTSRRQSPFTADREHFHHMLIDAGLGVRGAFFMYILLAVLLAGAGLVLHALAWPDSVQFPLFIVVGVAVVMSMYRVQGVVERLPAEWRRIPMQQ